MIEWGIRYQKLAKMIAFDTISKANPHGYHGRFVVKEINKFLKEFLWSSGEVSKGGAKVAWKIVCKPNTHGGLGLKDLGMEKMSSGANNGAKPLKSILKITRPKGAAGDTIDAAGAGKTKKDGVGIQPFKVRRKVSIAPDGTEHVFTYVQTESSDHVCSSVQMNEVHQVAMPIEDVNEANKSTSSLIMFLSLYIRKEFNSPCNEGIKSFANLFNDMGGVMDSNEASKKLNFRSFVNEEKVENSDIVLPRDAIDKVKNKYENSLVGYFIGKSLAFPIVQNYVNNTWGKFGLQKLMRNDDGIFLFKFADKRGMEQVLVCIKVPLVAYSEDGLSLIATQIGKPLMLDAFTSTMCVEAWGRISFARALVEISSDTDLKKEVIMAVPNEDGTSYTREVISVEYEWQPPSDGFTEVERKKNKGKKADEQPRARHIDGIRLTKPKPNFYWQKTGTNKSGADLVNKGPTDANSSINKVNGPSTSNSFDILNNVDEGDACCVSSYMGNEEVDQAVGHATISKHTSPTWNEDFESDDEVDEGKLLTQDMILRWGSYDDMMVCILCKQNTESHDLCSSMFVHSGIWSNMLIMMDWNVPNFGWNEIVERLTAMPCKRSIGSNIRRLCLETRIMGLRVKKSSAVSSVAAKWNIISRIHKEVSSLGRKVIRVLKCLAKPSILFRNSYGCLALSISILMGYGGEPTVMMPVLTVL
ncbi:putative reverse transcriptase domain, reverse transcriptase zinc-binding domain protein [Tanacetum coccineum]